MKPRIFRRHQGVVHKAFALLVVFLLVVGFGKALIAGMRFMSKTGMTPLVVVQLLFDGGARLAATDGRTNILILGMGGGDHDGADLTDSILIASMKPESKSLALLSIPRDIWSDTLKDKINTAYHYGEEKSARGGSTLGRKGGGIVLSKVIVEDITGLPIHYVIVVDFAGFVKVIDQLGGIDVQVADAFTDDQYPIPGKERDTCPGDPTNACLYETIHFDAGVQHMDGARALMYVRSRHAAGSEGNDFARGKRQQEVILAIKNRMVRPLSWLTFTRARQLPKLLDDATDMDMRLGELLSFGRQMMGMGSGAITRIALDSLLESPPEELYGGRFVLLPKTSFGDIHEYIKQQLQ